MKEAGNAILDRAIGDFLSLDKLIFLAYASKFYSKQQSPVLQGIMIFMTGTPIKHRFYHDILIYLEQNTMCILKLHKICL